MNTTSAEPQQVFSDWEYRNIALAAVTQCALHVHELATTGQVNQRQMEVCMDTLLVMNPETTADVYPDIMPFSQGLDVLQKSFDSKGLRQHPEAARYMLGMLVLQQRLMKMPKMQARIGETLQDILGRRRTGELEALSEDEFIILGQLYQDTLSSLTFRIHVSGNPQYLRQQHVAHRIRALLLAGIRSAVLWHQLGGRRWHLLFYKNRIKNTISGIRRKLMAQNTVDASERKPSSNKKEPHP